MRGAAAPPTITYSYIDLAIGGAGSNSCHMTTNYAINIQIREIATLLPTSLSGSKDLR